MVPWVSQGICSPSGPTARSLWVAPIVCVAVLGAIGGGARISSKANAAEFTSATRDPWWKTAASGQDDGVSEARAARLFRFLDHNDDGVVSPGEAPARFRFESWDSDGDGRITEDEWRRRWSAAHGRRLGERSGFAGRGLGAWDPDGERLDAGGSASSVRRWSARHLGESGNVQASDAHAGLEARNPSAAAEDVARHEPVVSRGAPAIGARAVQFDWILGLNGGANGGQLPARTRLSGRGTASWPRVIRGVSRVSDGGAYVSGSFFGDVRLDEERLASAGTSDILVARVSSDGRPGWTRRFGSRGMDIAPDVATDGTGAALVTGMCSDGTDFDGSVVVTQGGSDAFTAKLTPSGRVLWVRTLGGLAADSGNEICADGRDNVLVTGSAEGQLKVGSTVLPYAGGRDSFVVKYSPEGELLWARVMGGPADDQARGIATDPAGDVLVAGEFRGTMRLEQVSLTAAGPGRDVFVASYDAQGALRWARRFGAAGEDYARGIGADGQGNIYVTGVFSGEPTFGSTVLRGAAPGREQLFLMRMTPAGEVDWVQGITGPGEGHGCEIEVSPSGDSVIACDLTGELRVGDTRVAAQGRRDAFLAGFARDGSPLWVKTLEASGEAASFALAIDQSGARITTVGVFRGTIGDADHRRESSPGSSSYIARLDSSRQGQAQTVRGSSYVPGHRGPYQVEVRDTLIPAERWQSQMALRIYIPKGRGPFPLIVFVSGTGGINTTFEPTSRFLASHGYVVLHNSYPRQRGSGNDELTRQRVLDARLVLDSLDLLARQLPAVEGKIDPGAIGAMGHSSGAYITQLLGGATISTGAGYQDLRDPRIGAIVTYSGPGSGQQGLTGASWRTVSIPLLSLTGTRDRGAFGQDPAWRRDSFELSPPGNKYIAQYQGGHHGSFSGRFINSPQAKAVFEHAEMMTLAFFDAYLKKNSAASEFLRSELPESLNDARLEYHWR